MKSITARFQEAATYIGAWLPRRALQRLRVALYYAELGNWMKAHEFASKPRYVTRAEVFEKTSAGFEDLPVVYLEFGVYRGASLRAWSTLLQHPETQLHAFDTFEGLPEVWDANLDYGVGMFTADGCLPQIGDPRVQFHVGLFEDELKDLELPRLAGLIVNIDADLYSSTVAVLNFIEPHLRAGSILYFDDLFHPDHELRAFDEFMQRTGLGFEVIAADSTLSRVSFRCLGKT